MSSGGCGAVSPSGSPATIAPLANSDHTGAPVAAESMPCNSKEAGPDGSPRRTNCTVRRCAPSRTSDRWKETLRGIRRGVPRARAVPATTSSRRVAPGTTTEPCTRWSFKIGKRSVLTSISQSTVFGCADERIGPRHGDSSATGRAEVPGAAVSSQNRSRCHGYVGAETSRPPRGCKRFQATDCPLA